MNQVLTATTAKLFRFQFFGMLTFVFGHVVVFTLALATL